MIKQIPLMKLVSMLTVLLLYLNAQAHLKYIDLSKIDGIGIYSIQVQQLREHASYFDHWTPQWNYPVSKDSLIRELKSDYGIFTALKSPSVDLCLLQGEVAHYLYNLDEQDYFENAVHFYEWAIRMAPDDYRGYWFLGNHYALSNVLDSAFQFFEKARVILPGGQSVDFWNEYGYAMAVAGMPTHSLFAMDKARALAKAPSFLETQLKATIEKQLTLLDPGKEYESKELWTASGKQKVSFVSRPLGMKILLDSSWNLQFNDYSNYRGAVIIKPPVVKGKKGNEIGYTIAVIIKVAQKGEKLQDFMAKMLPPQATKYAFTLPYKNALSYEIRDKKMYPDWGGEHSHMIGVEQDAPSYPGFALEEPLKMPADSDGQIHYFQPNEQKSRFPGRIFYVVLLDSCEDIYPEAWQVFSIFFKKGIVIE
jgi:tetratricopeptide (TPR) repeat protein